MRIIKKFTWSEDQAEIYFGLIKILYIPHNTTYVKVKGIFAYRRGLYKDFILQGPSWYKIKLDVMKHWIEIKQER